MKTEGLIFGGISAFLASTAVLYWFLSYEVTGTTCLALSAGLAGLIGYYSVFVSRRFPQRPEDSPVADVADGHGVVGHFSPQSYFPIGIAFSATLLLLGVEFGLWLSFIGIAIGLFFVSGLLFEHITGEKAVVAHLVEDGVVDETTVSAHH